GSSVGSRVELAGQRDRVRRLAATCAAGGLVGSVLLLLSSSRTFERVVPWLIAGASVAILVRPRPPVEGTQVADGDPRLLTGAAFGIAVYGGYFGAAAGVLMLSALLLLTPETVARSNGVKNVVMTCANAVAAVAFMVFGPVRWVAVIPLSVGFLVGGRVGPIVVRRVPVTALRLLIAAGGMGLAVHLGLDAYSR
ncbi:MAG: sulfite exporter TauE/SafE family protein, partial [Actinomycetes bacterium]